MQWLLATTEGVTFLPSGWSLEWTERWEALFNSSDIVYGGFLWSDIPDLEATVQTFHQRLCLDFQTGWSAVCLTARCSGLGPFAAPTAARPHAVAPKGLYLLSAQRLLVTLTRCQHWFDQEEELCRVFHRQQRELGPVFCDPKLEVSLQGDKDFDFKQMPSWERFLKAVAFLFKGKATI